MTLELSRRYRAGGGELALMGTESQFGRMGGVWRWPVVTAAQREGAQCHWAAHLMVKMIKWMLATLYHNLKKNPWTKREGEGEEKRGEGRRKRE